jgi:dTDP-4-amino-4,6-dideoxygalactose transaminase
MSVTTLPSSKLIDLPVVLGGPPALADDHEALFHWPIVTAEDEHAVIDVLRAGKMSAWDITQQFEAEWGGYIGTKHNLAHCNGTMALLAAMFGVGVGRGDEIIVPSITYWASGLQAMLLGATPVFAEIHPETLCIDPAGIEKLITPQTKAIVAVHYCGHPADMDAIMEIARRRNIKVIEDVSHAHGSLYKGRICGAMGDVAGFSMMAGKSFAIGEAGMLSTNDRTIFERAVALCHYERCAEQVLDLSLRKVVAPANARTALPLAGLKGRVNQTCSAMGRVQLKYYPQRIQEIQSAINRFWDLLDGTPGLRPHRCNLSDGSTMGGWYNPLGHYLPEELGGLTVGAFVDAVNAEGSSRTFRGSNFPLHLHAVMRDADTYHDGKPTRIAFASRDVREAVGSLPVTEQLHARCIGIPYFKHDDPELITQYANAFKKVAHHAEKLVQRARS